MTDLSLPFILGLGAALDEFGVSSEVSSTVLNKLFVEIGKADRFKDFADVLGLTVDQYKELIRNSPEEAFVKGYWRPQTANEKGFLALSEVLENRRSEILPGADCFNQEY